MKFIYLNGKFCDENDAKISIKDRGFKFGDGVFETIRIYKSSAYNIEYHLARLKNAMEIIKIKCSENLYSLVYELISKNEICHGTARISITRGGGGYGYLPDLINSKASIVIETNEIFQTPKSADLYLSSYRKIPLESLPTNLKLMNGMNSTLARIEAKENGFYDSIMLDLNGNICETSSSNIFWVKDGILYTPSLDLSVLNGNIRNEILSCYNAIQGKFTISSLYDADEVFITNSAVILISIESIFEIKKTYRNETATIVKSRLIQKMEDYANKMAGTS